MARAVAAAVPTVRRSSRIQQQTKASAKVSPSTTTSSSTKGRSRKKPPRKISSQKQRVYKPASPFPFLRLPREIRDMIYTLLVSNGHLSIQRTSREISLEVQSDFYRAAISRQSAGYPSGGRLLFFNASEDAELRVQNFELRCNLDAGPNPSSSATSHTMQTARRVTVPSIITASDFARSDIRRNRMVIELGFHKKTPLHNAERSIERYLDEPQCFLGFQHLVVTILPMPRRWNSAELTRISEVVKNILEPGLGPGVWHEDEENDGGSIEFHPWRLAGQQTYRLEPVLYMKRVVWDSNERDYENPDDE